MKRLELSGLLGGLDHAECQPILDGAERIEGLQFHEDLDTGR